MKSLVIGAGSIGTRHAAVLAGLGHDVAHVTARDDLDVPAYASVADAVAGFEPGYVVLATETARHAPGVAALAAAGFTGILLVEKPLAVPPGAFEGFRRVGVGFNLRFHPVILRLREILGGLDVFTVEAYAGQHLAGWRPGRPLSGQYSGSAARGGGVLRDLSHEFDYLRLLLGECTGVFARGGRISGEVTVDADDAWGIVASFERAPVSTIQLNYLDTRARRRLVINTSGGTIEADIIAGTLSHDGDVVSFDVERNATYEAMHHAMLGDGAVATIEDAAATDELIAMIERSALSEKWVTG